jgi:hypothetical protein
MGVRSPLTPTLSPLEKGGEGVGSGGNVRPFLVRRIPNILYLCPHPKLSRYGTAIEDSLKASSRSVLPALQAGGRGSDG